MPKTSFDLWMKEVDAKIDRACGLSSSDLADIDYPAMFEAGDSPADAAREALENEGFDFDSD